MKWARLTNRDTQIQRSEHFDRKIRIHLANDLHAASRRKMGLLDWVVSLLPSRICWSILAPCLPSQGYLREGSYRGVPNPVEDIGGWKASYTVQVGRNVPVGVNDGLVTTELDDLAHDNDMLADVRVEIGASDARGGCALHGGWNSWEGLGVCVVVC